MNRIVINALLFSLSISLFTGCNSTNLSSNTVSAGTSTPSEKAYSYTTHNFLLSSNDLGNAKSKNVSAEKNNAVQVVTKPDSVTVLVNKHFVLPKDYKPSDLVYPNVPFLFKEKNEKRKMRNEAAKALENLFAGAKKDGIYLAGVSAYRSYSTQKLLFDLYVRLYGEKKARTFVAVPGASEHQTGLAIDVSGIDGKCAAQDCFAGSKEAKWLAQHAAEYGFIIRYPKGKESITGYQYEPWHIRYVGTKIAKEIARKGITLEEYLNAVPVSK